MNTISDWIKTLKIFGPEAIEAELSNIKTAVEILRQDLEKNRNTPLADLETLRGIEFELSQFIAGNEVQQESLRAAIEHPRNLFKVN